MFTPNGVSLCPFRVLELLVERFYQKHKSLPLTPFWFFIVPNEEKFFGYDDPKNRMTPSLEVLDYIPLGFYFGLDKQFCVQRNCGQLLDFHEELQKRPFLVFHLSCGAVSLEVVWPLCVDKACWFSILTPTCGFFF